MAYLKEISKIKGKFFEKILTMKSEKHFLALNGGVNLYAGSTYVRVNTGSVKILLNNWLNKKTEGLEAKTYSR